MTLRRTCVAALSALILAAIAAPDLGAQAGPLRPGVKRAQGKGKNRGEKRGQGILPQRESPTERRQGNRRQAGVRDANGQLLRLMQMTPERRKNFFETNERFQRLPEARRQEIRRRLDEMDRLPAEEKELLVNRYQLFNRLPRDRQAEARELFNEWRELPRERRNQLVVAVRRLRTLRTERREVLLKSERFVGTYDETERSIIARLLALTPEPNTASRN